MSTVEEFEALLKDVVHAKRLSASKMQKLTESALKIMDKDTQVVSILYRTHKATSGPAKLHSLYVFDALVRAARHQVNKHGLVSDSRSQTGNCASFLLKAEGVVEGVIRDTILSGNSEAKEKAKKILDIWAKGNTFTSTVMSRLASVLKGTEKVSEVEVNPAVVPSDPRGSIASTPAQSTADAQAALLALLTQAASTGNITIAPQQIDVNTTPQPLSQQAQLYPAQLAVLQQLAQNVKENAEVAQVPQVATTVFSNNVPTAPSSSQLPATRRNESHVMITKDPRPDRYRSPEHAYSTDNHRDYHTYLRGGNQGGPRGRGRGDRRRWDGGDRDRDYYRERERSPIYRERSRSRSPTRRYLGSRRDSPRRPTGTSSRQLRDDPNELEPGKDEFGRDLRPQSPDNLPPPITPNGSDSAESSKLVRKVTSDPLPVSTSSHAQRSMSPSVAANTSSKNPNEHSISITEPSKLGLEHFNLATFDFTSSTSWETLGKMWQVTNGCPPSTEQLMQFVMSHQATVAPQGAWNSWGAGSPSGQAWGSRGKNGGFAGDGEFVPGNGRNGTEGSWNQANQYATDAVVLGESDTSTVPTAEKNEVNETESLGSGYMGRMQRVGGKWVFVKDVLTDVS